MENSFEKKIDKQLNEEDGGMSIPPY